MAADRSPRSPHPQVSPGDVFDGRWRVDHLVGQGAMGSVFRGRDQKLNRTVAIKILAPEHINKPKVLARFEREAELMVAMRHPNIVQIHAHGRFGNIPYIVMEFLEGMTLAEIMERNSGRMPLAETVAIIKRIAAGLAYLHRAELVHRDIKPQNVFFTSEGRIAILDLGVVRDQANPGLTKPGALVGTPYYMSPEQIQGLDDIDRRTDVYALTAMTFELLTGRPPFLGANNFEVLYGHRNTPVPDATTLVKSIPKLVAQVLVHGMAKKRSERPDSASEFSVELEAASGSVTVDLGKTYKIIEKKVPARKKAPPGLEARPTAPPVRVPKAPEATRIMALPPPPDTSAESLPLADNADVLSVANAVAPEEEPPPADDPEATYVGSMPELMPVPGPPETETPRPAPRPAPAPTAVAARGPGTLSSLPTATSRGPATEPAMTEVPIAGRVCVLAVFNGKPVSATLLIDDRVVGKTPKNATVNPGARVVRVEAHGYEAAERTVQVASGGTVNVKLELTRG